MNSPHNRFGMPVTGITPSSRKQYTYQTSLQPTYQTGYRSTLPMEEGTRSYIGQQHYTKTQYGQERVIGVKEHLGEEKIVGERIIEHSIKVPKKVIREEVIEKILVVPEKIIHEEVIEDVEIIKEKIIEVSKPIIQEKIIEIPEYEYVEKIIEVPQLILQEKITEVPKYETQERIIEVPRIITQEKIVEIPQIEYKVIPIEKVIEIPEIREEIITTEVPVTQYIDKPIPEYVTIQVPQQVDRMIPVPIEAEVTYEYHLPMFRPRYKRVDVPLYVPRFIEIPVHEELLNPQMYGQTKHIVDQVGLVAAQHAASLCEVEDVAAAARNLQFSNYLQNQNICDAFAKAYEARSLITTSPYQHATTPYHTPRGTIRAGLHGLPAGLGPPQYPEKLPPVYPPITASERMEQRRSVYKGSVNGQRERKSSSKSGRSPKSKQKRPSRC